MQIPKNFFSIFLAGVVLMTTLIPYLKYISKSIGYMLAGGIVFLISFTFLSFPKFFAAFSKIARNSIHFWVFIFSLLISQYFATLAGFLEPNGLIKTMGYSVIGICGYFILPVVFRKEKEKFLWNFLAKLGAFFSLIGIIIIVKKGIEIFGFKWEASCPIPIVGIEIPSTESIFSDPNYFAVIVFIGFIASLYLFSKSKLILERLKATFLLVLNFSGIFLSYSRAAYLAIFFAILFLFLIGTKLSKKLLVVTLAIIVVISGIFIIQISSQLRSFLQIKRGLTGRELLWPVAINAVIERPLFGWGVGNVASVIQAQELSIPWTSSHNSFLDFFIMTGIPTSLVYLWLVAASIKRLYSFKGKSLERRTLLTSILGMIILMQFTTHTIGGISFGSFLFTVFLGIANATPIFKVTQNNLF